MNLLECILTLDPGRIRKWKRNVRQRHQSRIRLAECCETCGATGMPGFLTRHHEWQYAEPGRPPKPRTLCRPCHDAVEQARPTKCPICGKPCRGVRAARRHARRNHGVGRRQFLEALNGTVA